MSEERNWYTPYELGRGLLVGVDCGGCDDILRAVEDAGGQVTGKVSVDLHEEDGLLVIPCHWDGGDVELVGNVAALASVMRGNADAMALTVRGEGHAEATPLPRLLLTEDDFRESDTYEGYYESLRIAYRSCVMSCALWRSGNDGVWKDSWKTAHVKYEKRVDTNTFWDDVGSCATSRPLADAMALAAKGLAKCMHYVDLDPSLDHVWHRELIRQRTRHTRTAHC